MLLASGNEVDLALGGALLMELAMRDRVDVVDPTPLGDEVLDEALPVPSSA